MKSFITFLFILIASSTYRCGKEEDTIDCIAATASMLGKFDAKTTYSSPLIAEGLTHNFILEITEVNDCMFVGTTTYGSNFNNHVLNISGTMDKYGWIQFKEVSNNYDGGLITNCTETFPDTWCSDCRSWPSSRIVPNLVYSDGRYSSDPFEWVGEIRTEGWGSNPRPCTGLQPGEGFLYEGAIAGNYKLVKQ